MYPITTHRYLRSAVGYTEKLTHTVIHPHMRPNQHSSATSPPRYNCMQPHFPLSGSNLPSLAHPYTPSELYSSSVIPQTPPSLFPWKSREVTALRIRFPPPPATNYTAETLGVATAASLLLSAIAVYTDAKGIITSTTKIIQVHLSTQTNTTNFTDTGLLYKHLILNRNKLALHHIKAHQEDSPAARPTERDTCNRTADLVAQGDTNIALSLCHSQHVIQPHHPPLISIGESASQHDYYIHHPNSSIHAYHTSRLNDWLQHTRPLTTSLSISHGRD